VIFNYNTKTPVNVKTLIKTILKDIETEIPDLKNSTLISMLFLNINAKCNTMMKQQCVQEQLNTFVEGHTQLSKKKIVFVKGDEKLQITIPEMYKKFDSNEKQLFRETLLNLRNIKDEFGWEETTNNILVK
jgi:signal transduction histidine kinase